MKKTMFLSLVLVILMLLSACASLPEAMPPSGVDPKPYISFTSKIGKKIYLGMSREDCEKALGIGIEDGWQTLVSVPAVDDPNGALSILSLDGVIRTIGVDAAKWEMENGITDGTGIAEATKDLGAPVQENTTDKQATILAYSLADTYRITFIVGSEGKLISFGASQPTGREESQIKGLKQMIGSGTGNAHIEAQQSPREYIAVSHSGSGAFKMTLNTAYMDNNKVITNNYVVIDRVGNYEGRLFSPSQHVVSYDVVADGEWIIWAYIYAHAAIFTDENSFKGSGDFATLYISPDAGGIGGDWKVTHDGNGKFILRMNSFYARDLHDNTALLEVDGPYSGDIQVENVKYENVGENENDIVPMAFEIITEGGWTLERVK